MKPVRLDDMMVQVVRFLKRAREQPERHYDKCLENHRAWLIDALYFLAEHPDACQFCAGTGYFEYTENLAPFGSGENWPCQMTEPCTFCEEQGRCAVCGRLTINEDGERECGCPVDESFFYAPECYCWTREWEDDYAGA